MRLRVHQGDIIIIIISISIIIIIIIIIIIKILGPENVKTLILCI